MYTAPDLQHDDPACSCGVLQGYAFQMEIVVRARGLGYSISEVRSREAEPRASVHLE